MVDLEVTRSGLALEFSISSKGGGSTRVRLELNDSAVKEVLFLVAKEMAGSATLLTQALSKAVQRNATKTRSAKRRVGRLIESLDEQLSEARTAWFAETSNQEAYGRYQQLQTLRIEAVEAKQALEVVVRTP